MARLRGHKTLDYEQPLYVRRASLTVAGQTFAMGDVLPWRALEIDARKVHQLWMGRRVGHELVHERNGAESVSALVSPAPTALPAVTVQPDSYVPPSMDELVASGDFVDVEPENGATRTIARVNAPAGELPRPQPISSRPKRR